MYTLTGNLTTAAPYGIMIKRDNMTLDGAGYRVQGLAGMYLLGRSNVTIKNIAVKVLNMHARGIFVDHSINNSIIGSTIITDGQEGIYLWSSSGNSIADNNIMCPGDGVWLVDSSRHNTIVGNNITGSRVAVGFQWDCDSNNVSGNNIANSGTGIDLIQSARNIFSGNNISGNLWYGVMVSDSTDNRFYHNSFTGNGRHIYIDYSSSSYSNTWDNGYPSGGNYWGNYTGIDLHAGPYQNESSSDGIGDTPHTIATNDIDQYPLMGEIHDLDATPQYAVQTICNSTISNFRFNGTAILFNVSGQNDSTGFCRICIPTALMGDAYHVLVNGTEVAYTLLPCSNSTHNYVYFNYTHSTEEVAILPEFPSLLVLPLFILATLLAVIVFRKKHSVNRVLG
jgi:parallel beta-helix repeat protein